MRRRKAAERLKLSFGTIKNGAFNFDLISQYYRHRDRANDYQSISDRTFEDLDFEDLFKYLDRTSSKVGQQFLYNKLRTIPVDQSLVEADEKLITEFSNNQDLRIKAQLYLEKLNKDDAFYISSLFQEKHLDKPAWFWLVPILSVISLISIVALPFIPQASLVLIAVLLANFGIHYWNKRNLYRYIGSIPQLLKLHDVAKKMNKEEVLTNSSKEVSESINELNKLRKQLSIFQLEAGLQSEAEIIAWGLLELVKMVFLLEPILLFSALKRLDSKRNEVEELFCFVGGIDTLISIASVRKGSDLYCIPSVYENECSIEAEQLSHPLIANCVRNSIKIVDKSILLTGSNMSGKTSFIRTLGLNIITGLTINTCFAKAMSFSRQRIYSAIRISDDLLNDKSYYFEEVLTIKQMLDRGNRGPNLFLLDEIFKGTNTVERIAAGKAVLSKLSENGNKVLVSTHDIELTDLLTNEYELYHFSEVVNDKNVDFDYQLKEGPLTKRNAIRILQINNYPAALVKEAMQLAEKFECSLCNS